MADDEIIEPSPEELKARLLHAFDHPEADDSQALLGAQKVTALLSTETKNPVTRKLFERFLDYRQAKDSTFLADVFDGTFPVDLETRLKSELIVQEHRPLRILANTWGAISHYLQHKKLEDPKHKSALEAFFWRIISPTSAAAVGFTLTSILTIYLAYQANKFMEKQTGIMNNQTDLIQTQNDLIKTQNHLNESQRRSALVFELTSILDQLQKEQDDFIKRRITTDFQISDLLRSRITSLSRSLRPYRYLGADGDLTGRELSPERGQLLISLASAGQYLLENIGNANFSQADLQGASLSNNFSDMELVGANFDHADLRGSYFQRTWLQNSTFAGTRLPEIVEAFYGANLQDVDWEGAIFDEPNYWNDLQLPQPDPQDSREGFNLHTIAKITNEAYMPIPITNPRGFHGLKWFVTRLPKENMLRFQTFDGQKFYQLTSKPSSQEDAFFQAIRTGNAQKLSELLDSGLKPDLQHYGIPALIWAITADQEAIASMLLDRGASVQASKWNGQTALVFAVLTKKPEMVKLLAKADPRSVSVASAGGFSPLALAAKLGPLASVNALLDQGADSLSVYIEQDREDDVQPWILAFYEGQLDLAHVLMRNPDALDSEGNTPLISAIEIGLFPSKLHFLFEHGADPNKTVQGKTPLMVAVEEIFPEFVDILLEAGAQVDIQYELTGQTALDIARDMLDQPGYSGEEQGLKAIIASLEKP